MSAMLFCNGQTVDYIVETNLVDELKTEVRFRKSKNYNIDSLNRLSHLTDKTVRRPRNMRLNRMIIGEMVSAPKISKNDNSFYFYKNKWEKSSNTKNIFINDLMTKYVYLGDISPKTIILNSMIENNCIVNETIYAIDQNVFSVDITDEILTELQNETRIFAFKYSQPHSEAYLKDFSRLGYDEQLKWLDVFDKNKTCNINFIKSTKMPKIIGELKIENDEQYLSTDDLERLDSNLEILKTCGYDSVLVRFYVGQNLDFIIKMINHVKTQGFDVYVTYTGLDNRKPVSWNPFADSNELERYISVIAPYATGWFLNWRSTSQHVKLLPKEFYNYLCNTIRKYNNQCMIYGEIYYGQIDPLRTTALIYNIPNNVSGVLINNMGFYGYNHAFIVNKLFVNVIPEYKKLAKIAQVVGYRPYYSSRHNLYLSTKEEFSYKAKIENNFRRVKCGTLTFIHDGVDDNYAEQYNIYQS